MRGCRPLTKPEVDLLTSHLRSGRNGVRNAAFLTVGLMTGFRVSELLSVDYKDVVQCGRVVDSLTVRRSAMKGKREGRTVRLNTKAKAAIQAWVEERGEWDGPLFCTTSGRRLGRKAAWKFLTLACESLGMTGTLGTHCLRKTFADRMHDLLGGDLKQLQGALGHKWITSTSQYLSFKEEKINEALDAL